MPNEFRPQRTYTIRPAREADAEAIAVLANALGQQEGGPGDLMTGTIVRKHILSDGSGIGVLVADQAGDVVGYCFHTVSFESAFAARGRYIIDLFVAERARRRGIATALLAEVALISESQGGVYIHWLANQAGAGARELYAELADISQPVTGYAVTRQNFDRLVKLARQNAHLDDD